MNRDLNDVRVSAVARYFAAAMFGATVMAGCRSHSWLVDMTWPSLRLEIPNSREGGRLTLFVLPDEKAPFGSGHCDLLAPKAAATVNGVPLHRMTGIYAHREMMYDRDCILEFGFPGPVQEAQYRDSDGRQHQVAVELPGPEPVALRSSVGLSLRIQDSSKTWTLDVPDAFSRRRLVMESPSNGLVQRGAHVRFRWYPEGDRFDSAHVSLSMERDANPSQFVGLDEVAVSDNRMTAVVPRDLAEQWDGKVKIRLAGRASPAAGPCPVAKCTVALAPYDEDPAVANLEAR